MIDRDDVSLHARGDGAGPGHLSVAAGRVRGRIFAVLVVLSLVMVPCAAADLADETALAERYAPVVRLVAQAQDCGYGESYEPIDVDLLFDEETVALRGPWGPGDLIKVGPTAKDLSSNLYEYHLDFPGSALDPGCDYERWANHITEGKAPAVYAHVATDTDFPGQLALQFWLYYVFNDWNNTHEGDWENIQIIFEAADARQALSREPVSVGYSQHEGSEKATWGDEKLELVDGTHPVVYPAAGSHANFFESALFLGSSAEQGVGCDDTTGPSFDIRPDVGTIPSDPGEARTLFPWIGFEGRWGEFQRAFFNGPTGPNLKTSWIQPISVSANWRDKSYAVPAGGSLGTTTTDFFCTAIGSGSTALRRAVDEPLPVLLALGALLVLILVGLSRATWRPTAPLRLARRRSWGQVITSAARMYAGHLTLFLGIGLVLLPISLLVTLLQALVIHASSIAGISTDGESGGALVFLVFVIGTALTLVGLSLVIAASARAMAEIDRGRPIGPFGAYRLAFERAAPLFGAVLITVAAVSLLVSSVLLVPVAIWLAVRWSLAIFAAEFEGCAALEALRRSRLLVRGHWLKVASLAVFGAALALVLGPLVGALLILLTNAPLSTLNLVAGVVNAVTMPFVALITAYVYFDARARVELEPADEPDRLPAEFQLSG
jgi:hypothetical protein